MEIDRNSLTEKNHCFHALNLFNIPYAALLTNSNTIYIFFSLSDTDELVIVQCQKRYKTT